MKEFCAYIKKYAEHHVEEQSELVKYLGDPTSTVTAELTGLEQKRLACVLQNGNKKIEEEETKIIEEESEKKRINRVNNDRQIYDLYSYKDTEIKTFINEYKKSKYKVKNQPFQERKTMTISIQNDERLNNSLNENTLFSQIDQRRRLGTFNENNSSLLNNSTYILTKSPQCPGCGRLLNNGLNFVEVENSMCPGCGRMIIQNLAQ